MIGDIKNPRERFFAYSRERHNIYLRRARGEPRPWTAETVLRQYRFTNVFRELDKTTIWLREHVRAPLWKTPELLLPATVLFRMFNRIATGEAIFSQTFITHEGDVSTAFEEYVEDGKVSHLRQAVRQYVGREGPYVTGSYIISTPPGHDKLDGVLRIVDGFVKNSDWRKNAGPHGWIRNQKSLYDTFCWLRNFDYLGTFHSYEIVTDLRHTPLLGDAHDVNSWANVGPGAMRGLNRIHGRRRPGEGRDAWGERLPAGEALVEMRALLDDSRNSSRWPQWKKDGYYGAFPSKSALEDSRKGDWPAWELREVEHTLCEFDKFERARLGEGRPRGRFD